MIERWPPDAYGQATLLVKTVSGGMEEAINVMARNFGTVEVLRGSDGAKKRSEPPADGCMRSGCLGRFNVRSQCRGDAYGYQTELTRGR